MLEAAYDFNKIQALKFIPSYHFELYFKSGVERAAINLYCTMYEFLDNFFLNQLCY